MPARSTAACFSASASRIRARRQAGRFGRGRQGRGVCGGARRTPDARPCGALVHQRPGWHRVRLAPNVASRQGYDVAGRTAGARDHRSFPGECGRGNHGSLRTDPVRPAGRHPPCTDADPNPLRPDCGARNALLRGSERRRLRCVRRTRQRGGLRCRNTRGAPRRPRNQHRQPGSCSHCSGTLETRTHPGRARQCRVARHDAR